MSLNKKILVVDDDVTCVVLLAMLFRQYGFEVVEASSGEEAREKLDSSFNAVVTDMHMGDERMNGNDVAELAQEIGIEAILLYYSPKCIAPKEDLFSHIFHKPADVSSIARVLMSSQ